MFRIHHCRLRKLAGFAAFAFAMGAGGAGALELSPLTVLLDEEAPIGSLLLRNDTEHDAAYQITGFNWSQDEGRDVHDGDTDLIVTPPIVSLAPGESVVVRVGLLAADADVRKEDGYRLLIRDISQFSRSGSPLRVRTQVLLPVFVRPRVIINEINAVETRGADGRRCITMRNRGSVHQKLVSIVADGAADEPTPLQQYVLAGQTARVCPPALGAAFSGKAMKAGFTSAYSNKVEYHDVSFSVANTPAGASR